MEIEMKKNAIIALLSAAYLTTQITHAAWTLIGLPDTDNFNNTALGHLSDGRFIYGHNGTLYQQDTFGVSATSTYTNAPAGDYPFVNSQYLGLTGAGFPPAPAPVYSFNSLSTTSTFSSIGNFQVFGALVYNTSNLVVVGLDGGNSDLGYLTASGTYTTLIDGISTFSAGITGNSAGDIFVADNDDQNIYRFTASQIASAIGGTPLTVGDGQFVVNLGVSGSIAYDDTADRLYAAGFQVPGIQMHDLATSQSGNIDPVAGSAAYSLATFSDGTDEYISFVSRDGFSGGDSVTYGYDLSSNIAIPEPSTLMLLLLGGGLALTRRHTRR